MGQLRKLRPPAIVTYDGTALRVVGRLAKCAVTVSKSKIELETLHAQTKACNPLEYEKLEETIATMAKVCAEAAEALEAFDTTYQRLQDKAEVILESVNDGDTTGFLNKGSDKYVVLGVMHRRHARLSIVEVAVNEQMPAATGPLSEPENVILVPTSVITCRSDDEHATAIA